MSSASLQRTARLYFAFSASVLQPPSSSTSAAARSRTPSLSTTSVSLFAYEDGSESRRLTVVASTHEGNDPFCSTTLVGRYDGQKHKGACREAYDKGIEGRGWEEKSLPCMS